MGEAKRTAEAAIAGKERPTLAIIRLRQSVTASKQFNMDPDTEGVMKDMEAALDWIAHLEKQAGETPVPKLDA